MVGQGEVCPVEATLEVIKNFPPPITKKQLMHFLGMVGYYRSFCKDFYEAVAPLTDLLKSKVKFVWSTQAQCAFENVKALLCSSSVLAAPQPFTLQVYVGAGLLQADDILSYIGVERPVRFKKVQFISVELFSY